MTFSLQQTMCRAGVWLVCATCTAGAQAPVAAANAALKVDPQHAEEAYLAGARLLDRQELAAAQDEFARAVKLDPNRPEYRSALMLTREHRVSDLVQQAAKARMMGQAGEATLLLAEARQIDPTDELVVQHVQDAGGAQAPTVAKLRTEVKGGPELSFAGPLVLEPQPGPQDLHEKGDVRQVLTRVAQQYGVRVVFDDSVSPQAVRFDLDATPYTQAMPILLKMTKLFAVPVDTHTLLVAKDTAENRGKMERQIEETLYIPGSTTEQLNELTNIIKNVFDVKQVVASPVSGTLVIRAPAPTLQAVNYTLSDMLDGGAEVQLEVKLVTVDKSITRNTGVSPPTSASAFSAAAEVQSFVSANASTIQTAISSGALVPTGSAASQLIQEAAFLLLSGLATDAKLTNVIRFFGNGLTLFGASIGGGATLNLGLNSSYSQALEDVTVRIADKQTATLRVGEKYPITTATYSSGISSATASALAGTTINGVSAASLLNQYAGAASAATVPMIQYEDLGLTLKTTPTVLRSDLISLHIDMKIEALTGTSLNNIPVLTSSVYTSDITVPNGNTVVMLSDVSKTQSSSISGLPGLGELPGFSETLSDAMKTTDSSELILLITPHLVRRRATNLASRAIPFSSSIPTDF